MAKLRPETISLRRVLQLHLLAPTEKSTLKSTIEDRLKHCEYMYTQMSAQAQESGLNEYKRYAHIFKMRIKFYKHLLNSSSKLVIENYFINNQWVGF